MIPDPSYPTYESANRAMQMSDAFVQQARMQAQAQMYQQQMAFTGGQGGGQPGIMAYAAGAGQRFMGGMASGIGGQMSQFMGGLGTAAGVGAVVAQPMFGQVGNVLEGSRYTGAGARESFTSLLATAYAPLSLFPQAGTSFGMEQGLRRQTAREETSRRMTQAGRGVAVAMMDAHTLGLGSYFMRRSGSDVAYLGEQDRERAVQQRLGFLRGAQYGGSEGLGVGSEYLTRGAGRELMRGMRESERGLQHSYGLSREQMDPIRALALGSVDVTRVQQAAAGGHRTQAALGREVGGIEQQLAAMARAMQLTAPELTAFGNALKTVTKVTNESLKAFNVESLKAAGAGPFSQAQVGQFRMQAMGYGQQTYMNATSFASDAMRQAQRVSEARATGAIGASTLLREGGGLDPDAMMRMTMARIQQQAQLVQGGNFNQSLLLASQSKGAFSATMGGAGFFQMQGAAAAAMIANPWAMLQARMDPSAVQRVTMAAPAIAFVQSQQRDAFMIGDEDQRKVQKIASFGRQMGMDMNTAQGANNARVRYEELEDQRKEISAGLSAGAGNKAAETGKMSVKGIGDLLFGFTAEGGISAKQALGAMDRVMLDTDLSRAWQGAKTREEKTDVLEMGVARQQRLAEESATGLAREGVAKIQKMGSISPQDFSAQMRDATSALGAKLDKAGLSHQAIVNEVFGVSQERLRWGKYYTGVGTGVYSRFHETIQHVGGGKFQMTTRKLNITKQEAEAAFKDYGKKEGVRVKDLTSAQKDRAFLDWAGEQGAAGRNVWSKAEVSDINWDKDRQQYYRDYAGEKGYADDASVQDKEARIRLEYQYGQKKSGLGGVLGILSEAGVSVEGQLSDIAGRLSGGKLSEAAKKDARLAPVVRALSLTAGGSFDPTKLPEAADSRTLRNYFKNFAKSEEGKGLMKNLDPSNMTPESMINVATKMSTSQQENLNSKLLMGAMEKSARAMTGEERGSINLPTYVIIKSTMPSPSSTKTE